MNETSRKYIDGLEWGQRLAAAIMTYGEWHQPSDPPFVMCSYCGWKHHTGTPHDDSMALREHIELHCPEHPLGKAKRRIWELEEENILLRYAIAKTLALEPPLFQSKQ